MNHDYKKIFQRLIDLHDYIDEVADSISTLIDNPDFYSSDELATILDDVEELLGDIN